MIVCLKSKTVFLFQRGGFLARPEFRDRSPMQRRLEGEGEEMVDEEEEEKEDANNVMKDHEEEEEEEEEEAKMNNHNDNNNSNHTEEKVRDNHRLGTC